MSKKNHFILLFEYFLFWISGDPFHAVILQKYFMHMRVKTIIKENAKYMKFNQFFHCTSSKNDIKGSPKIRVKTKGTSRI